VKWSPSGRKLAFVKALDAHDVLVWERQIWIVGSNGTNPLRVATAGGYGYEGVSWSPDGHQLLFSSKAGNRDAEATIYAVDVASRNRVALGRGHRPSYSPDGRKIAFLVKRAFNDPLGRPGIARADGSARRLLSVRWLDGPVWSPEGAELAGTDITTGRIVAIALDGARLRQLAPMKGEVQDRLDWRG
jgi:Tol biopolymer transport system component